MKTNPKYILCSGLSLLLLSSFTVFAPAAFADRICAKLTSRLKSGKVTTVMNKRTVASSSHCPSGYIELLDTASCTGPTGATGATGPQGPAGDAFPSALPSNKTITGYFSISGALANQSPVSTGISFPVPLTNPPGVEIVSSSPTTHCKGTASEPAADPGFLCIYPSLEQNIASYSTYHTLKTGVALYAEATDTSAPFSSWGTWAVTGE